MATISVDINASDVADVQAAICAFRNFSPASAANAKAALISFVKELTQNYRVRVAQAAVASQPSPDVT